MKSTKQLRCTAYHEAGHAYASHIHGVAIKHVTITPDDDSFGHVEIKLKLSRLIELGGLPKHQIQKFYEHCEMLFAGRAAEKFFCGRSSHYGASKDREMAIDIATRLFGSPEAVSAAIGLFYIQAKCLVMTPKAQLLIPLLAQKLIENEKLTGEEVKRLFREVLEAKFSPASIVT